MQRRALGQAIWRIASPGPASVAHGVVIAAVLLGWVAVARPRRPLALGAFAR